MSKEYIIPFVKFPEVQGGWVSPHLTFDTREQAEEFRDDSLKARPELEIKFRVYSVMPSLSEINNEVNRLVQQDALKKKK